MNPGKPAYKEVSMDDVAGKIAAGAVVVLLDANPPRRYKRGHLPGAIPPRGAESVRQGSS